ncbi:MAG: AarF/UbiB family protein [Chloroflexota bacterium]|jgi:ubiquinone biosynthesis protein
MRRTTIDKVRENLRLQQVYNVFLRYGYDSLFDRWELLSDFHHRMQRWVWQLPEPVESLTPPVKMRLMLEELGPTYVKMGQIVSSQASVIPDEWEVELEKLQSNVPPFPSDQVREILVEELGAPPEALFASFEPEPFAAASTAQVHRATLDGGLPVAVKVQRPHIRQQMKADLGIMQNAARVASRRSDYLRSIDLVGMLEEFSTSVLRELDYTGEAYNAFRLGESMDRLPGVHVPIVYQEYSTSRVMTMEFVTGVKISDLQAIDAAGIDRQSLASNTLRALVKQLLVDGFFHADPHPGNILVNLETGDATFIDMGMVGELDLMQRINLVQLVVAIQQQDVTGMAQVLYGLSAPFIPNVNEKAYFRDFQRTVGRYVTYSDGTSFGESVPVAFNLLREHGLRLDPQLTMAVKALIQAEAVTTNLYPEGGIVAEGVTLVRELAVQEITAERIQEEATKQVTMAAREIFRRLPTFQEATMKWLDQYQKGRFEVTLDTSELAKEVDKLQRLGRQVVIGIILVGMIIGSAIASSLLTSLWAESEPWRFVFRLAYFGYVFSMIVAIVIVTKAVWDWMRGNKPA